MKISLACDHAGYKFKEILKKGLESQGHKILDFGCQSDESCDYPDFGIPAAKSVAEGQAERAILICGNGLGMSILANKIPGVIAGLAYSRKTARETRRHHNSNVLCLGGREFEPKELLNFVRAWLEAEFEAGRHETRINKVRKLDKITYN